MSYQNQQLPPQLQQQQQQPPSLAPTVQQHQTNVPPPLANHFPNGPTTMYAAGLKQQYLPPQIHTNGLDNSRNVSPALSQPLNAAHLPPTSASIQQQHRPMYAPTATNLSSANANVKSSPIPSNPQMQSPPPPPQQQPPLMVQQPSSLSSQPPTMNYNYQSQQQQQQPVVKPPGPPLNVPSAAINHVSVDKVTAANAAINHLSTNLQNVHLNNGNGVPSPTQLPNNQMAGGHHQIHTANNRPITNGNSMQPSPTIPGLNMPPPKSITPNIAPPPLTNTYGMPPNSNANLNQNQNFTQAPVNSFVHQQSQIQQQTPQFNGMPGPIPNKLPPMNQLPQPQQQTQFKNVATPNLASNSTIGKRPLYPNQPQPMQQQQQQQMQPPLPQQQQQQPPLMNNSMQYNNQYQQQQQQQHQPPMPQQQQYPPSVQPNALNNPAYGQQPQPYANNVVQRGFDSMWGHNTVDLMQHRHILPTTPVESPKISLEHQFYESVNCSPDIFRCTLTKIPESNALLQKSRLPLGILIHPFRDLNNLPVIQCSTIVRCRSCRTYINPFVYFVDSKKWKCNLCFRINELPDEFQYDPVSKSYGDVTRRPEVKSSTIEFIAPSEYMLRPPQPAIYLFLLDVSLIAQQSGYLRCVCESLAEHLDSMPGDVRTRIGFVAYNSAVHFYSVADGFNRPHEITVVDIDDPFLPCPDNLLINLNECKELIKDLLTQLPTRFAHTHDSNSALGAALQVAFKLMQQTGGRVTVFQTCLPNVGPGALQSRENPNERSAKEIQHLGPATDFYKRHALECSGQQIAVDLFLMNSQYSDLATISGISKFSGGCIHHFPLFSAAKPQQVDAFKRCFERYLTRKIGFESVMRIRCTRGLTIHTFHGNFFVRSTDLLSLPNVNPDAGYGMQISYDENLGESKTVCFQAALLYTSSKGERRIRVHTLCLPITNCLADVMYSADAQAIIGLISKMAVDRSLQSSIADARDAFINASCDIFSAFHVAQNIKSMNSQLVAPRNLALLPLYMLALLKHPAFRTGTSTRLDDRVFAMCELKTLPLDQLIRYIYPDLYHLDCLFSENNNETNSTEANGERADPPLLQLSAEHLKSRSMFLLDCGTNLLLLVGSNVPTTILKNVFGVQTVNEIPDLCFELPNLRTADCDNLHSFLEAINVEKPYTPPLQIIRDNSPYRSMFIEKLVDDRSESSLSYYEFLQHLRTQVK